VTGEIDKAKRLAAPFLEQPLGEERHPIQACAYNPKIEGDSDPKRKSLISEHLGNYGGEQDDEISPQEILFYNAIYGIRARDLSKYSPERSHVTEKRPAGQYFSAYYQLVSGINPSVAETKVLTPHIDRRWHWISQLPDLDEESQGRQLKGIHHALLMGLVYRKIVWTPVLDDERVYRFRSNGELEQDFIVSNGTPCDRFYEVIDALTINPVAVARITDSVNRQIAKLQSESRTISFHDTPLADTLKNGIQLLELEQIITGMAGKTTTLFDVTAFFGVSVPKESYSDLELRTLMTNLLDYLRTEVESAELAGDSIPVLEAVLRQQFDAFVENVPHYLEYEGARFARRIRTLIAPLADLVDELHLREFAKTVEAFDETLLRVR
jgi:hypothetical protein